MAEPQTLRADARRNRDQIIAAAKTVFAERGPDVPMEEVARRAGVGVGTLYRRFPDRDTLIREVARDSFTVLLSRAREAEAEGDRGWEAFLGVLKDLPELWFTLRLTLFSPDAWAIIQGDAHALARAEEFTTVFDGLVRVGQAEGTLRSDVGTGDVLMLIALVVTGMRASSGALGATVYERVLALSLDGLRANSDAPLPGRPLTPGDLRFHD
ncbi:TetR/AcrR family transcriptional regulator [Nocardiopsis ansamitocini]|uniref:TetR family transcriptional regulator n=1 Tax=Nocardiopsis ansamitocini TaxID=1670832 RepID=A0A9W6UJR1_9ACTN|nr:TetR/AcrR family transcriptional regulator [Nocardiopsis ansamitocini]GLU49099.1 TetR family transcriptional regulator [Nocardiopsis ansamitocini]